MQRLGERAENTPFGNAFESQGATVVLSPPSVREDEADGQEGAAQQAPDRSDWPELWPSPLWGPIETVTSGGCEVLSARSREDEEEEDDMEYFDDDDEDDLDDDLEDDLDDDLEDEEEAEEDEDL